MPLDSSIQKVLIIGSGPIIIGQACEFDYSGSQACRALREEGIEVVLINSNPATIMTDPEMSDRTYIEPINAWTVEKVIEAERPDALLPTLGGQTGLNVAKQLADIGILAKHGVRMIGADRDVIDRAEDREKFREIMEQIGLSSPPSATVRSLEEARDLLPDIGLPAIIRASFTLGGTGSGMAYNVEEYEEMVERGLEASPIQEVLIEASVIGWKEYELEIMRDRNDNCVVVCTMENVDPMGVHTGDSVTVAPAMTLSDKEYQRLRDAAFRIMRAIGVETGGSNVQFSVDPETGQVFVIEMNPRVSRSSALASKATGFPIAKIAAKLAVGYTLDELQNDITRETVAAFEPSIDYVVTKLPRFNFEKFPSVPDILTTRMQSVGEAMAIGRTFRESLQKALRSLEIGSIGLGAGPEDRVDDPDRIRARLTSPNPERLFYVRHALRYGFSVEEIYEWSGIDPWFLNQIRTLVEAEEELARVKELPVPAETYRRAKQLGFSDAQLALIWDRTEPEVRRERLQQGVRPVYKLVDTCAAEFEAKTPYYYSSWEEEDERLPSEAPRVMILGGGPNRIGQGIEFDYCAVHAALAMAELGYETIMVNSNPETVSTDYDISSRLFFEPLTLEDVLNIVDAEQPVGLIVQLGGQTPLKLARGLEAAGVPILGTSPTNIDRAEDREQFAAILKKLDIVQPRNGIATDEEQALSIAREIGFPVMVRPSYVLGGRAMEIVYDEGDLQRYMRLAVDASPEHPVLIDEFLEDAIEVDVDAVSDGTDVLIAGVMEHIEEAGIHSGDSTCSLPPYTLGDKLRKRIERTTEGLARELEVRGLLNVQYALKGDRIYVLEANPRASRTIPFVAKATGIPLARVAARVMAGRDKLADLVALKSPRPKHIAVKKSVFPFNRFPGLDILLGPEMRSTGEVMGIDNDFGVAFAKAQAGATLDLPTGGCAFVSVKDADKRAIILIAKKLEDLGFHIVATSGTYKVLVRNGIQNVEKIRKVGEGRPNILDRLKNGEVDLVINTPSGKSPRADEVRIRSLTVSGYIPCLTTLSAAQAAVGGIESLKKREIGVTPLQDLY